MIAQHKKNTCKNMNHGKMNPAVTFCPNCGERFKTTATRSCDEELHKSLRKDRSQFCHCCGKRLVP